MLNPKALFLLCLFCFASLGYSQPHGNYQKADLLRAAAERKKSIEELSARLAAFQIKLSTANLGGDAPQVKEGQSARLPDRSFHGLGSKGFSGQTERSSHASSEPISEQANQSQSPSASELSSDPELEASAKTVPPSLSRKGFYILPFIALQRSSDLDTNFFVGGTTIEHNLGFSSGWRIGHKWKNFFVEGDFSYFRNDFKALSGAVPNSIAKLGNSIDVSGEGQGYGVMINLGPNFDLGASASVFFGAGAGAFSQELELNWNGQIVDDEQSVFGFQLFSGINLHPSDHIIVGLRYRWLMIGKTDSFSDRDLHLLELSLGYIF